MLTGEEILDEIANGKQVSSAYHWPDIVETNAFRNHIKVAKCLVHDESFKRKNDFLTFGLLVSQTGPL